MKSFSHNDSTIVDTYLLACVPCAVLSLCRSAVACVRSSVMCHVRIVYLLSTIRTYIHTYLPYYLPCRDSFCVRGASDVRIH